MRFTPGKGNFTTFENLLAHLQTLPTKQSTLLIGVDGCGGSGKSTFATELAKACETVTIIHMDDFYLPSNMRIEGKANEKPVGADFDWRRLKGQVLEPLSQNQKGTYQRYDWSSDTLAEWYTAAPGGIVVIEGVYAIRRELAPLYDYKIFVHCPREIRLQRGIARDGENARYLWEKVWMVAEDKYQEEQRPFEIADLVIDGFDR